MSKYVFHRGQSYSLTVLCLLIHNFRKTDSLRRLHRTIAWDPVPLHVYSEVSFTEFTGTHSQEDEFRIIALH